MKRLFLILIVLLIPVVVYADSIKINCDKTSANPGDIVTCNISGITSTEINGVDAELSLTNLTANSITTSSGWYGDGNDGKYILVAENNKTGTFAIGQVKVKVGTEAGTITFSKAEFSDKDFNTLGVASDVVKISITNPTPSGNSNNNNNNNNNNSVTPSQPVVENQTSSPTSSNSQQNLQSQKETKNQSNNSYLKSLKISSGTLVFDKNVLEYKVTVDSSINEIKIDKSLINKYN